MCVTIYPITITQAEEKVVHHEVSQNIPPLFSSMYLTSSSTSEGSVPMATESPSTYPPSGRITTHPYLLNDTVQDVLVARAFLIIRIVELKIGRDQLHQASSTSTVFILTQLGRPSFLSTVLTCMQCVCTYVCMYVCMYVHTYEAGT